jgi:hypothetical protein
LNEHDVGVREGWGSKTGDSGGCINTHFYIRLREINGSASSDIHLIELLSARVVYTIERRQTNLFSRRCYNQCIFSRSDAATNQSSLEKTLQGGIIKCVFSSRLLLYTTFIGNDQNHRPFTDACSGECLRYFSCKYLGIGLPTFSLLLCLLSKGWDSYKTRGTFSPAYVQVIFVIALHTRFTLLATL